MPTTSGGSGVTKSQILALIYGENYSESSTADGIGTRISIASSQDIDTGASY